MHHGMQTPPQMQQQSHFIVDHRARPEDAAVHITVSLTLELIARLIVIV
jgi:hypothetical protein